MFGLFKKKSKKEILQGKYQKLMAEAHRLSKTDRKASDQKAFEAEEVMKELEALD